MVITRQRPGAAKGFVFLTLEDDTGISNIIVRPDLFLRERMTVIRQPFLLVEGVLQHQDGVLSVRADRVHGIDGAAAVDAHDFYQETPIMRGLGTAIYHVPDLARAKAWYAQAFPGGSVPYWRVEAIGAAVAHFAGCGARPFGKRCRDTPNSAPPAVAPSCRSSEACRPARVSGLRPRAVRTGRA